MYEFLKPYVNADKHKLNYFVPVDNERIAKAEARLGFALPPQLKEFYRDIGFGFLLAPKGADQSAEKWLDNINRVVDPTEVADLYLGNCEWGPREGFSPEVLPFFDVGDGTFLVLKIESESDPAVYWPDGKTRVAQDLGQFFRELYKDPSFYLEL